MQSHQEAERWCVLGMAGQSEGGEVGTAPTFIEWQVFFYLN